MEIRVIGIKAVKVNREMTVRPEQTTDLVREIISVLLECQISMRDDDFLKSITKLTTSWPVTTKQCMSVLSEVPINQPKDRTEVFFTQ